MPEDTAKERKNWTANQRKFMEWLRLPSTERIPLNQTRLAEEMKVRDATLSEWKRLPGFMEEVQSLIRQSLGDNAHEVMGSFKKKAATGSFPHQKTYLEMMGWHTDKQQTEGELTIRVIHVKPDSQQPDD